MSVRAMWKAQLCFGEVTLPVKLYAAVEDRSIHFRMLHATDGVPVKQRMVDPVEDEPVPPEAIRKGMEVAPGVLVALQPEELEQLAPEPSRRIEISRFVPTSQIGHAWYDRPYYLGPDGDADDYVALAKVLDDRGLVAIAHWVMRKKAYVGALRARGPHLVLITLKYAEEVVELPSQQAPHKPTEAREAKLAEQLVATLEDRFDPAAYQDEYRDRVMQLIESKARGEEVVARPRPQLKPPAKALSDVLQESLRAAKEKRSA